MKFNLEIKMIKNLINRDSIKVDDLCHFLKRNDVDEAKPKDRILLDKKNPIIKKKLRGKFLNWFELDYSYYEKYYVAKFKDIENNVYNFLFKRYYYLYCSEQEIIASDILTKEKNFLEKNKIYGSCTNIGERIPFTPTDIRINPIDFLKNDDLITINKEKGEIFYLFKTVYKINKKLTKYYQDYGDIRYFVTTNNLNLSGSYEINLENFTDIYINNESLTKKAFYVRDENIKYIIEKPIDEQKIDIKIFSFDIETEHYGKMPSPLKNKISHIGLELYSDSFKRSIVLCNSDMVDTSLIIEDEKTKFYKDYSNFIFYKDFLKEKYIYMYMSEKNMLLAFSYLLTQEPDIILTFNGNDFDFKYIKKRGEKLFDSKKKILYSNNILDIAEFEFKETKRPSANEIRNVNRIDLFTHNNIMVVDIMNYCKSHFANLDSYSLDSISKKLFNNSCKFSIDKNNIVTLKPLKSSNFNIFKTVLKTSNYCFINDIAFEIIDKTELIKDVINLYDDENIDSFSFKIEKFCNEEYDIKNIFNNKNFVKVHLSKDAIDIGNPESYKNYDIETCKKFSIYCIHDTILCREIFLVESVLNKIFNYSESYLLAQEKSSIYKACSNVKGNLLKKVEEFKYAVYESVNIDLGIYDGGYVCKATKKYVNKPVLVKDFTSLYPTCIIEGNISPDTLLFAINTDDYILFKACLSKANIIYKYPDYMVIDIYPNNIKKHEIYQIIVFDRKVKGLIPSLLESGMQRRKEFKRLLKLCKNDIVKYKYYDSGQYCEKIGINSIYGLTGLSVFPFGSKICASACTALGRKTIIYTKNILDKSWIENGKFFKPPIENRNIFNETKLKDKFDIDFNYNKKVNINVIYGDTDSVFLEIDIKDIDKARKIGNELEKILNNNNFYTKFYNIEFEAIYYPFILCAKKKYLGYKYSSIIEDKDFNEISKGISIIRRDYSSFHKNEIRIIKDSILENLQSNSNTDLNNLIVDQFRKLIVRSCYDIAHNKISPLHFAVSCNYSGKYKDKKNKTELLIKNHNKKKINIIEQGSRFYYVILVDKNFNKDRTDDIFKYLNWNTKPIKDVNNHKYILNTENIYIPSNKRISIEYYLNKIYKDLTKSFADSIYFDEFKKLFK